jgi:hypothetical protein
MLNSKNILLVLAAIIIIGTGATAYYFFSQYQSAQHKLDNPNQVAQQETQALIDKMSKIIDLPKADIKNGEPTLATVLDKSKLKDQPFFDKAENGDKVLIYTKAKKAFLYRPDTNKIINVAPVSIGAGQEVKVAVLNGTNTSDLGSKVGQTIKDKYPTATIASTANAAKSNYDKTIVVDLTGKNADAASTLASGLGAEVGQLPSGETAPAGADLLVIIGSDQK